MRPPLPEAPANRTRLAARKRRVAHEARPDWKPGSESGVVAMETNRGAGAVGEAGGRARHPRWCAPGVAAMNRKTAPPRGAAALKKNQAPRTTLTPGRTK